ncbi:MAG: K(+)-transporting ATPase subunit F [Nocardioidaceae bacterium]|nr:K(+)-transporting ATPase subunit F [Nocardioidaceae bacterium]
MDLDSAALLLAVAGLCGYLLAALVWPEKF